MNLFLKMKAWQLFVLLFGSIFLVMALGTIVDDPRWIIIIVMGWMLIFMAVFTGWVWTIGAYANRWVPAEIRPISRRFRMGLAYASVYMALFPLWVFFAPGGKDSGGLFAVIFLFHILAIACMFYALYFATKNLVMAERKQSVGFYEFAGLMFLVWMYPIGVWFIQPRVNRMLEEHENTHHE